MWWGRLGFYPEGSGEPLKYFKQRADMIRFVLEM